MKAGLVQFRPAFLDPEANALTITQMLSPLEFDLMVIPELANSGYFFSDEKQLLQCSEDVSGGIFIDALRKLSQSKNAYIVSGLCERYGSSFFNSAVLVRPSGETEVYRKIHLFDNEKKWFTPGSEPPAVYKVSGEFGSALIGMMICFDWFFPETARTLALLGAQVICHPSNLVLSYCQKAMFTRAVENRVFTITANRTGTESSGSESLTFTGQSVMVSPRGEYLAELGENDEIAIVTDIEPAAALNKNVTAGNNLFKDRRTELYKLN